ncbi:serine carboxypeptidase [Crepidotus variabilis]|uniref:Carboxypeptidase n=1 Tax=Crepidotus variabilis TaxID=179855 RepID=A0A9P6JKF7_9AGAR|nr:serine carboxypeptidase [Crepidotus variabilis]
MRLLFAFGAVFLSFLPGTLSTKQVPVINGIAGGVPNTDKLLVKGETVSPTVTTPGRLRVVENSGVCETTPGVYQASGYGDLTSTQSIWFWFFAARKNPDTAPLALWFNGGPGSSSMIGLFQEHGPCRITNDSSTVVLNPNSWNTEANVLYIDQPVGVGFSHGDTVVGTSQEAASDVWKFLQIFFADARFAKYQPNPLALWTESYGGHYGPTFAAYFLKQNIAIDAGTVSGKKLNLKVLGIGNGITDPLNQYYGYIVYAGSNPYHMLASSSAISSANSSWSSPGGCKDQITSCYNGGSESICTEAQSYCNALILYLLGRNWDLYDVRQRNPDIYPPDFSTYINSVRTKIGAEVIWNQSNTTVYTNFAFAGDWMRNSAPDLEYVINSGVRTLIYDGDADFIVNYVGVESMVDALQSQFTSAYHSQAWTPYEVHGQVTGQYKAAGTFAYLRIYGAGHEVPAYTIGNLGYGEAALQFFNQITSGNNLTSTCNGPCVAARSSSRTSLSIDTVSFVAQVFLLLVLSRSCLTSLMD